MSTAVTHHRFIEGDMQLVSPQTVAEWREALDPSVPDAEKLAGAVKGRLNQGCGEGNLRLVPELVSRIEELTGIEVKVRIIRGDGEGYLDVAGVSNTETK